ncbi:hypothetical protein TruAng_006389 [Truncatella angustata]|nr:hypothetical protein TruAng_006389 [Truncatella angustata]
MIFLNQSRSQSEAQDGLTIHTEETPVFSYQKLSSENSIRLLTIEPSECGNDPLMGTLSAVEFGQKPNYYALSYMWGNKSKKIPIILNGDQFLIGQNLYAALRYMRNQKRELPFWVDAICINQNDLPERNHQLQIMHQIYFRANTVVIWLGNQDSMSQGMLGNSKMLQSRCNSIAQPEAGTATLAEASPWQEPNNTMIQQNQFQLAERLYRDEYWHRLWIIQEVAQACQLEVCYGQSGPLSWGSFITLMKMHDVGSEGPLKLEHLRQKRFTDDCILRRLLSDHEKAECEEPRDKIYGLVGLATDNHGFPAMDYNKSLVEVWTDVMQFINQQEKLSESEILSFGALVKLLLLGQDNTAVFQVLRPDGETHDQSMYTVGSSDPKVFKIKGSVIGKIEYVGTSVTNMFANLENEIVWRGKVQTNYPDALGRAGLESRKLLHAIFHAPQKQAYFNHVSALHWVERVSSRPNGISATKDEEESALSHYLRTNASRRKNEQVKDTLSIDPVHNEPRLIQLRSRNPAMSCKMGIASCQAKEGDLVVRVPNIDHAVIVRPHTQGSTQTSSVKLQVYGTALLTEEVAQNHVDNKRDLEGIDGRDSLTIQMDAATLFVLLS